MEELELCIKMMSHATFSGCCDDMKASDISYHLSFFFSKETIDDAVKKLKGQDL